MPVIMLINLKGGVAKTTTSVAVAECLARMNYRTLVIDADHQSMSGEMLLGENRQLMCERNKHTLHDLMAAMYYDPEFTPAQFSGHVALKASNIAGGLDKLSVLPCSIRIDDFETNMRKSRRASLVAGPNGKSVLSHRRAQMKKWLGDKYDFTIVDCPPSLAFQVKFLLGIADGYIIPCIPDRLSLRGALYLAERIRGYGYKLPAVGLLWSLCLTKNNMHRHYMANPDARLPTPFETTIPNASGILGTSAAGSHKSFSAKYGAFSPTFKSLCLEIIQRTQWQQQPASTGHSAGDALTTPQVGAF